MIVPSVGTPEPVTVTVYGPAPDPLTPVTDQLLDVPPIVKSDAVSPVTDSSNVSEYVALVSPTAADTGVNALTTGAPRSMVTDVAVCAVTGPARLFSSVTVPVGSVSNTVPVLEPPTVTV